MHYSSPHSKDDSKDDSKLDAVPDPGLPPAAVAVSNFPVHVVVAIPETTTPFAATLNTTVSAIAVHATALHADRRVVDVDVQYERECDYVLNIADTSFR